MDYSNILEGFKKFAEEYRKITERFNYNFYEGLSILADNGWYIDEQMPMSIALEGMKHVSNNEIKKLDKLFCDYYTESAKEILKYQVFRYTDREKILTEAYKAHDKRMYFASIALFLSQADGICKGELFKTRKDKAAIKAYMKELYPSKVPNFLQVITTESAIDVYFPQRDKYKSELNRHGVFHGYDVEYGNKTNSLKAMSLLAFITGFFGRYVNK